MAQQRRGQPRSSRPPGVAEFVGRAQELSTMHSLLASARSGRGGLLLLTGEAGIGKTRLIEHFAALHLPRPASLLWGRCHADPDVPAYWPWKQAIAQYADRCDDSMLRVDLAQGASDIVPLVPRLVARFPEFAHLP